MFARFLEKRMSELIQWEYCVKTFGTFFKGVFSLAAPADTFIDMSAYKKGVVWVNGHNLGRYWDIGPQKRLYCPAPWLKAGTNQVVVFDLHQTDARPLRGATGHE